MRQRDHGHGQRVLAVREVQQSPAPLQRTVHGRHQLLAEGGGAAGDGLADAAVEQPAARQLMPRQVVGVLDLALLIDQHQPVVDLVQQPQQEAGRQVVGLFGRDGLVGLLPDGGDSFHVFLHVVALREGQSRNAPPSGPVTG